MIHGLVFPPQASTTTYADFALPCQKLRCTLCQSCLCCSSFLLSMLLRATPVDLSQLLREGGYFFFVFATLFSWWRNFSANLGWVTFNRFIPLWFFWHGVICLPYGFLLRLGADGSIFFVILVSSQSWISLFCRLRATFFLSVYFLAPYSLRL